LGGIAGNAGLFTIVDNVGYYMQLMLNKGKMHLSSRVFSEEVVDLFTTKQTFKNYTNTRALGWDTVPLVDPPCGTKFSKNSFGFSDPMGSYMWADKDKNITIVLLAANGYPVPSGLSHAKAQG
jgi:CubicO group peptidase (beta-lactamase class C family)